MQFSILDNPTNEMELDINVFGVCMILVRLHEHDGRLVV